MLRSEPTARKMNTSGHKINCPLHRYISSSSELTLNLKISLYLHRVEYKEIKSVQIKISEKKFKLEHTVLSYC